jgi:hypothetical protein
MFSNETPEISKEVNGHKIVSAEHNFNKDELVIVLDSGISIAISVGSTSGADGRAHNALRIITRHPIRKG